MPQAPLLDVRRISQLTINLHGIYLIYVCVKTGLVDAIAENRLEHLRSECANSKTLGSILEGGTSIGLWNSSFELSRFGRNFVKDDPNGFRAWVIGLIELQSKMLSLVPDLFERQKKDPSVSYNYHNGPVEEAGIAGAAEGVAKFLGFRSLDKVKKLQKPNCRVLDVGCGRGEYLIHLAQLNNTLQGTGIEKSGTVAGQARERIEESGLSSKIRIVEGDLFETNLEGKFDFCLLNFVLHYFSIDDRPKLFSRCNSLLEDGGALVILEPVLNEPNRRQRVETIAFDLNLYPQNTTRFGLPRINEMSEQLTESGFQLRRRIKPFPVGPAMCYLAQKTRAT